jgi:hypothetical protein
MAGGSTVTIITTGLRRIHSQTQTKKRSTVPLS